MRKRSAPPNRRDRSKLASLRLRGRVASARPKARGRGRPSKFGRPGRMVALTLPNDTLQALRQVDPDTGWAIVKLLEREPAARATPSATADVELLAFGSRQSLIVVNRVAMPDLPGVRIIPLNETRAFLALDIGRSMSDLELAVIDRLTDRTLGPRARRALLALRGQLAVWRRDRRLLIRPQAILVVEESGRGTGRRAGAA